MSSALTRALRVLADCLGSSTSGRGAASAIKAVPPSAQNSSHSRHGSSHGSSIVARAAAAVFEPLEGRTMMSTTYYVSPSGNDANKGTISSPWRSTGKVSGTHLGPGDHVLFQGGQTFYGGLNLYNDGGSATNPVVIGSYGNGKATINSGSRNGAWSLNSTGMSFQNLKFVGSPQDSASHNGIRIENYSSNTTRSGFTVNNCDISGYGAGIGFGADSSSEGLSNVTITNNNVYNNEMAGIESWSVNTESNTHVYIGDNMVHDNYGDGHSICTGSGIMLQGINGGVVERNQAYHNGAKGGNGGVGIWAYSSNNLTFQYNESYNNVTTRGMDGDGFDFDCYVTNSVIQYNYAFNNDGTGIQLDQWKTNGGFSNNVVRYNVLQNNGRRNNYGNLEAWGDVDNCYFYNNVIYTTPGLSGNNSAIRVHNSTIPGLYVNGVHFVDNIIETAGGAVAINITSGEAYGAKNLTFTGNVYWAGGAPLKIHDGSASYSSLAAWQSAGQETWGGKKVGFSVDPKLINAGNGGEITNINALSSLTAYQLQSNSPIRSQGLNVSSMYGVGAVSNDFYGNAVAQSQIAAGADQTVSKSSSTPVSSPPPTTTPTPKVLTLVGANVGSPKTGSSSGSGTNYTVTGSGDDIWNNTDSFRYEYTTLSGNGQIIARVASQQEPSTYAKAGIMIRNGTSLVSNSTEVSMLLEPSKKAEFQTRAQFNGISTYQERTNTGDQWVKLVRSGNTFSGYVSSNGTNWTLVGTSTVNMSTVVTIGLAVTSHDNTKTNTASFSNVAIT